MKKNLHIFPFLKRAALIKPKEKSELSKKDVEELTKHYTIQLIQNLKIHGFELDQTFINDFSYVEQFLYSSLLRNIGEYHFCQDYIDDVNEFYETVKNSEDTESKE